MNVKDKNIKNHTYYFFHDIINVKDFDPDNTYLQYWICDNQKRPKHLQCKSLYLIFGNVNGYFEEIDENKYLMLVPTNKSKVKYERV